MNVTGWSFGVAITNLKKEIRYFYEPIFVVNPPLNFGLLLDDKRELRHNRFGLNQVSPIISFPKKLEYGEPTYAEYSIPLKSLELYYELEQDEEAYVQAFVTTTLGEIYESNKYKIQELVKGFKTYPIK